MRAWPEAANLFLQPRPPVSARLSEYGKGAWLPDHHCDALARSSTRIDWAGSSVRLTC